MKHWKTGETGTLRALAPGQSGLDAIPFSVVLASHNGKSLMLEFDAAVILANGGLVVGSVPVLWDDELGAFVDIIANTVFVLTSDASQSPPLA